MSRLLQLYYVRHGETEWSLSGQHTGRTDIPLTAHGEDEARALAPWLRTTHFDQVLVSPRQRARRTCELAGLGAMAHMEPDLSEWNYGDYEGRRSAEIRAERPNWNLWTDGCPGGESPADVTARVDGFLGRLTKLEGNIALFAHGHIGSALATRWSALSMGHGRIFPLRPASLSILGHEVRDPEAQVIVLWNATPALLNVARP
jgi:broad specificity phosphatase PhoE